ncbi:hypothetical protein DINM_005083 [Dirofilaria immitis]|nr:hypothetical protein [Dirofilaria immitis]
MALDLTAYGDGTTNCTIDHILLMGRDTCSMPGQIVRMRGSIQERMQRCRGKMGRSIKGLRGVQSGQSEGEVLDWTVRSKWGGGVRSRMRVCGAVMIVQYCLCCTLELAWGGGTCMHPHPCFAACLPRKRQEAARQQQQQHPLVASNSGLSAAVPAVEPTTVTVVDRLKHQLLQAYDNVSAVVQCSPSTKQCTICGIAGDTEQATDVIIKLEKSNLTKELLEWEDETKGRSVRRVVFDDYSPIERASIPQTCSTDPPYSATYTRMVDHYELYKPGRSRTRRAICLCVCLVIASAPIDSCRKADDKLLSKIMTWGNVVIAYIIYALTVCYIFYYSHFLRIVNIIPRPRGFISQRGRDRNVLSGIHSAPELSKQCRTLIKCWQKLAEPGPTSSGSSSTNGTPSYASPVVRRGLTPGTPSIGVRAISGENSRLTAVGNACLTPLDSSVLTPPESSDSRSTVPSTVPNGRAVTLYQRSRYERAANTAEPRNIQKSHTVGADLAMKAVENSLLSSGEIIRNGKRKGENTATSDIGISNGLSAKHLHYSSATVSPAIPHQSLLAARRADVKSTSELVAQLTENLPGYLAINISQSQVITRNEHDDNEGQANVDISQTLRTPVFFTLQPETSKKKEKPTTSTVSNRESIPICSTANSNSSASKMVVPTRNGKYDWYAMLPSLETLRSREHFRSKPSSSQRKSYIMNVLGREVLALPYIDVGLPDFLEYQYPRPERFYAEENFIYGAPRPN